MTSTPDPNADLKAYLSEYIADERDLAYAVLLVGPWGVGKSYMLQDFLKSQGAKHLYVSLYGLSALSQIDDELFRQIHPVLSSPAMKFAGKLLKGAVKGTLKIDLDGDGKDDGSVSGELPSIDMQKLFSKPSDRLLVFDDLERCSIPIPQVLGYINSFVEHSECKAIIVANRLELETNDPGFTRIKEKLIGQTLEVRPSVDFVYENIIDSLNSEPAREFCRHNRRDILDIFEQSGLMNLRVLKQALWDVERMVRRLRTDDLSHTTEIKALLLAIFALSLETRSGRMSAEALENPGNRFSRLFAKKGAEPTGFEAAQVRYSEVELRQDVVDHQLICDLLIKGLFSEKGLHAALDIRFAPKHIEAAWRRAWNGYLSDDAAYEAALLEVQISFSKFEFVQPPLILHVAGILLLAARIGAMPITVPDTVRLLKAYIDVVEPTLLASGSRSIAGSPTEVGYGGLGYTESDRSEFRDVQSHLEARMDQLAMDRRPDEAIHLLEQLINEPSEFAADIAHTNERGAAFAGTPILHLIDPGRFAQALICLSAENQYLVFSALKDRYTYLSSPDEDLWRPKVKIYLDAALPGLRPMSRVRLQERAATVF